MLVFATFKGNYGFMKKVLFLIIFICTLQSHSQELGIPVKFLSNANAAPQRYLGTDAFGWQYTITDNEFKKQKDGQTLKYKNVALGEIYKADLQNPLQIILFYRRFNTVVLLDNQLNETSRINFSEMQQQPVIAEAVGLASQNRLWLYDVNTQQIGLYTLAQGTFRTLTPPFNDGIKYYQNDYNYFYWIDNAGKCFAVNLFGKVSALGSVPAFSQIQILSDTEVLFSANNSLYLYDLATQSRQQIQIVEKSFSAFYYASQILSIFTESEIIQYKITLPR